MEFDVETSFNGENPLHNDNIPVANPVIIEVDAQPILEPKREEDREFCVTICYYIQISGAILLLIGMFGGLILFAIWNFNPELFSKRNSDD